MSDKDELKKLQRDIAKLNASINRAAGDAPSLLFREYAEKHLQQKLANPTLRDSSKALFRNSVTKHLIPAFGHEPLDKINNAVWLTWINRMRAEGSQLRMFFGARKALVEILNAAHREGLLERMPKLDNPDETHNVGRVIEDKEMIKLLWFFRRPFRVMFYTLFKMGTRPKETFSWAWEMITWSAPDMAVISIPAAISKTARAREIPINRKVARLLWRRKTRGNGSRFVFPSRMNSEHPQLSYDSAWRTALRKAGIAKCVPYDTRRTKVTQCATDGTDLIPTAKFLDTSVKLLEVTYSKIKAEHMRKISK